MQFLEVFKEIFRKIAGFFDIFDLSFFVAGAICLTALATEVHLMEKKGLAAAKETHENTLRKHQENLKNVEKKRDEMKLQVEEARRDFETADKEWSIVLGQRAQNDDQKNPGKVEPLQTALDKREKIRKDAEDRLQAKQRQFVDASTEAARLQAVADRSLEAPKSLLTTYLTEANVILVIIGVYVLGLLCFAVGRIARSLVLLLFRLGPWLSENDLSFSATDPTLNEIKNAVVQHRIDEKPYTEDDAGAGAFFALYNALWAKLRESKQTESYELIRRYWVLAATYDGVAIALLVWTAVLTGWTQGWLGVEKPAQPDNMIIFAIVAFVVSLCCFWEAQRFKIHQVRELMATAKYLKVKD